MDFHVCHTVECRTIMEVFLPSLGCLLPQIEKGEGIRSQKNLMIELEDTYLVKFRWRHIRMGCPLMMFIYNFGWERWQRRDKIHWWLLSSKPSFMIQSGTADL